MFLKNLFFLVTGMLVTSGLVTAPSLIAMAGTNTWTLEAVVRRTMEVAPEIRSAEAEIAVRASELTQAGAWPNPTVDLRADDRLGQEDGRGGTELTQIALSQPLPLRRLARQRVAAGANFESARENRRYQRLLLEQEATRVFHALQLTAARVGLARSRLDGYGRPGTGGKARDPLVRYLTPLERIRLDVLREEARQAVMAAEKEHRKALAEFRSLLALPADAAVQTAPLELAAPPSGLAGLEQNLDAQPLLATARREVEAARAGVAVAESQRFADPSLNLFFERDILNGERRNVAGVGVSFQIPLWNLNRGPVAKARAEVLRARAQLGLRQRDTLTRLRQSHAELARLIEQAQHTRANLLEPARQAFELTRRGFTSGELNLLALVDATNTHFDAEARYLELLKEAHVAAAELRLAAGIFLLEEREARP
jgi:cobalt-zinc-cadmium efflux system outer membrane protein